MKAGRTHWFKMISPALRRRVCEMIDGRQLSAREIFNKLNLNRHVRFRAFRDVFTARRKEVALRRLDAAARRPGGNANGPGAQPAGDPLAAVNKLINLTVDTAHNEILAGRVGKIQLARLLGQLKDVMKFYKVTLLVEHRAIEKHEAWKKQERRRQDQELKKVQRTTKLTDEQVAEIREKVLGL